jgi:23S rRNA (adenine2030-N6)-methyltransferase
MPAVKYRHAFHAGNFADVHKHVTVLALLRALQRKDTPLLYLDTHAGAGCYDLTGARTNHGAEARHGIAPLLAAQRREHSAELADYVAAVAAVRAQSPGAYPGSPLLAAQALRPQDRGLCCEIAAPECRALERTLAGFRRVRVQCGNGLAALTAQLPPPERRALILIDPPYEEGDRELRAALDAIDVALGRLPNAVVALWYPVKDQRTLTPWLKRAANLTAPVLRSELWLYPRDSRVALNGSGLLVVNPPYRFDERMAVWLPELRAALGAPQGGSAQEWLVTPAAAERA